MCVKLVINKNYMRKNLVIKLCYPSKYLFLYSLLRDGGPVWPKRVVTKFLYV